MKIFSIALIPSISVKRDTQEKSLDSRIWSFIASTANIFTYKMTITNEVVNIIKMLRFSSVLGFILIFLRFILIVIHYHRQKQRKITTEPRIKLNHNIIT